VFFCSPKQLHFREYLLPDGVSSIVPSGVNNHASNYSKCYPLSIVRRILYECYHIYDLCANIDNIIASGFVRTINRMKSLGYPLPPPLMLERKLLLLILLMCPLVTSLYLTSLLVSLTSEWGIA